MNTIKTNSEVLLEIKKSKFIGQSYFIEDVNSANQILNKVRMQHKKATHVCYAYVVNGIEKFSDDGEPQGTAGKPMLDCLKKQNINNCLAIVIRYYGGIMLGAGGLVRAYTNSVSEVIKKSETASLKTIYVFKTQIDLNQDYLLKQIKDNYFDVKLVYGVKIDITFSSFKKVDYELLEIKYVRQ